MVNKLYPRGDKCFAMYFAITNGFWSIAGPHRSVTWKPMFFDRHFVSLTVIIKVFYNISYERLLNTIYRTCSSETSPILRDCCLQVRTSTNSQCLCVQKASHLCEQSLGETYPTWTILDLILYWLVVCFSSVIIDLLAGISTNLKNIVFVS